MEIKRPKEYQTIRLFAILGLLTLMTVLLFKVVLFVPQNRHPAETFQIKSEMPDLQTYHNLKSPPIGQIPKK